MDPVTAIQLVSAISDILKSIYAYGKGVKDAPAEISRLRSELFGLKAALEHIASNFDGGLANLSLRDERSDQSDEDTTSWRRSSKRRKTRLVPANEDVKRSTTSTSVDTDATLTGTESLHETISPFWSPLLEADETAKTFENAKCLLEDLSKALGKPFQNRSSRVFQRCIWPFKRGDTARIADHLERIKTYFVLATTSDSLNICRQVFWEIRALRREFEEHINHKFAKDLRQSTSQWLSPCDPFAFQARTIISRHKNTGEWFLHGDFNFWLKQSLSGFPRLLWVRGKPGSGKTTLFSSCVEKLETLRRSNNEFANFAYFYCSATEAPSQLPEYVLGSLITQLCNLQPSHWPKLERYHERMLEQSGNQLKKPEVNTLVEMLADICSDLPNVLLLVDAPNESTSSSKIMKSLSKVIENHDTVRLLITSTEDADILRVSLHSVHAIGMNMAYVQHDISSYVESCIADKEVFSRLSQALKKDIIDSLLLRSDGSFRWVACQMESISQQRSPKEIREALSRVPLTLEETYIAILSRIPSRDRGMIRSFLQWITFSLRPLFMDEVAEAAILTAESPVLDTDARLFETNSVLKYLKSLVRVDRATESIGLAHDSVRTFLTSQNITCSLASDFYLDPVFCQTDITRKLIGYVDLPVFSEGYCDEWELEDRFSQWPLLQYASNTWTRHLKWIATASSFLPAELINALKPFLVSSKETKKGGNFAAWYQAVFPEGEATTWLSRPLYTAAREGLTPVIKAIIDWEGTKSLELRGGRNQSTPLHVAATYGHLEALRELLKAGADPNETNPSGQCGLNWAVHYRHVDIVKELIAAGADPRRILDGLRRPQEKCVKREAIHPRDKLS